MDEIQKQQLTLEIALAAQPVAGEGDLGYLCPKEVPDGLVRNVAHLVVLFDNLAAGVANSAIPCFCQGITRPIACAHVAIDARPPFITFTRLALS